MKFATFYPGPSRVYSSITEYIYEAYMEGIMSINHRSPEFMQLMQDTKKVLKDKLLIPSDYEIVFTSSATESWEIIAQSLTERKSQHFFNGAFGEKWYHYAAQLVETGKVSFELNEELPYKKVADDADVVGITQNETSNATQVTMEVLARLRDRADGKLLAADVTSSIAGVRLDFALADVWYGSVQKCFGLPAGLGLMILSPKAVEKAERINERKHYNSLMNILDNTRKDQTQYTPNVLDIYLLCRTQQMSRGIDYVHDKTVSRYGYWKEYFEKMDDFDFLVENEEVRSHTVLAIKHPDPQEVRKTSEESGIILGNGYGPWKASTFRIANFPAIKTKEIEKLIKHFNKHYV